MMTLYSGNPTQPTSILNVSIAGIVDVVERVEKRPRLSMSPSKKILHISLPYFMA